jgi:hypothetical protein
MPWAVAGGGPWIGLLAGEPLAIITGRVRTTPWPPSAPLPPNPVPAGASSYTPWPEPKPAAPPAPRYYGPIVCDFKAIAKRRKELGL